MKKQKRSKSMATGRKIKTGSRRSIVQAVRGMRAKRASQTRGKSRSKPAAKPVVAVFSGQPKSTAKSAPVPTTLPAHKIAASTPLTSRTRTKRLGPARRSRPGGAARAANRHVVRVSRVPQFTYMKAPGIDTGFDVGSTVEVFCDHERNGERVRGWIKGVVVQVDNKLVAVQFRSNVFLTDGWMVPDRILWYSLTSDQIRAASLGRRGRLVPDF